MDENKTAQPNESGPAKLVLEMAQQVKPPEFWEELKKRAKKSVRKWSLRIGGLAVLLCTNWVSYLVGKGADLSQFTQFVGYAAVAVLVFVALEKLK